MKAQLVPHNIDVSRARCGLNIRNSNFGRMRSTWFGGRGLARQEH